jgi:site-specific DNA recombinase
MKAVLYSRCSTDEIKQDVEVQLKELRRYAEAYGWECEEVAEYGSGYKGEQPKLKEVLERIRKKEFNVILVYSMDRFSREHPKKVNALLDVIVYTYGCRFIAIQQSIDSDNEMVWNVIKPLFTYFANVFSKNLSDKVSKGIARKKEKGEYGGGRPEKKADLKLLKQLYDQTGSLRKAAELYNLQQQTKKGKISYVTASSLLKKHSDTLPSITPEIKQC